MRSKLLILAGEPSGDLQAANLVKELRGLNPDLEVFGFGGDRMRSCGVELIHHFKDLSLVGFVEVFRHLPSLRRVMKDLFRTMVQREPALVILVDYPGFNLRFARLAKREGYKVVYYIAPQVWAWGRWRMRMMAKAVDRLIVVLPFEERLYQRSGMKVSFSGHPLLDVVERKLSREEFCSRYGLKPGLPIVGVLPGSREGEVERMLPLMLRSIGDFDNLQCVLALANQIERSKVEGMIDRVSPQLRIVQGITYEVMGSSDLLLVASGTATLEAAILGTPMLVVYKVSPPSWLLARLLIRVPHIGLVNLVAGREIAPEFVQFRATPRRLSSAIRELVQDEGKRGRMKEELAEVRGRLGGKGATRRAAEIVTGELR